MGKLGNLIGRMPDAFNRIVGLEKTNLQTNTRVKNGIIQKIFCTPTFWTAPNEIAKKGYVKPFAKLLANGYGTLTLLSKTQGFFPAMSAVALVAGGVGYLLGNIGNNTKDDNMGLIVEKENPVETAPEEHVAKVIINKKDNYHQINTGGMTWSDIIKSYYPDLVEKCDNQLYGKDGAIRKLKLALQDCCNDNLLTMTDIPKTLYLPMEIDGVKISQNNNVKKEGISQKGGTTSLQEAGCKQTEIIYTVKDVKNNAEYKNSDLKTAVDSLRAKTGIEEYRLDYAS